MTVRELSLHLKRYDPNLQVDVAKDCDIGDAWPITCPLTTLEVRTYDSGEQTLTLRADYTGNEE